MLYLVLTKGVGKISVKLLFINSIVVPMVEGVSACFFSALLGFVRISLSPRTA